MPIIYSFVARDTTILAEYTTYTGNFTTVAIECLQNVTNPENGKFTITCDRHTFNFLVANGFGTPRVCSAMPVAPLPARAPAAPRPGNKPLPRQPSTQLPASPSPQIMTRCLSPLAAFLAVADEAYGRQIPFAFLERVKEEFEGKWAASAATAAARSLDRQFGCVPVR